MAEAAVKVSRCTNGRLESRYQNYTRLPQISPLQTVQLWHYSHPYLAGLPSAPTYSDMQP
jgi:hypothetical protein